MRYQTLAYGQPYLRLVVLQHVGGVGCGIGSAVCSGMGWEQKAMVCLHGVEICSGVASGMHDADPINPVTVPGKIAGDTIGRMSA